MSANTISLPVIDLAKFPSERNKLLAACINPGIFRVVNHGFPALLLSEMKTVVQYLFDLSDEIKLRSVADLKSDTGYTPPSLHNPFFEAFGVSNAALSSDIRAFFDRFDLTSVQREIIISYVSKFYALSLELTSKVAESLGLVGYSFKDWHCILRLNKYNFTNETVGSLGIPAHTDYGFLTILQEDVGGLQIMDSTGTFLDVEPDPSTFLVSFGDMAKVWSNGRLYNMKHRVQCKEGIPRISIGLFILPLQDDKVEPHQELIDSEHPPLYRPFLFEEYLKYWASLGDQALSLLAADQTTVKA